MAKSTRRRRSAKPRKPHPDFPLFRHASGRWAKKVLGKLRYFGKTADDPRGEKALERWLAQKDDLLAGKTPRPNVEGLTVDELANRFLEFKHFGMKAGEIAPRTYARYRSACKTLISVFGRTCTIASLRPDDFQRLRSVMAKRWGPTALRVEIQMIRTILRYGYEAELMDQAIRFGPGFKKPSAKTIRQTRAAAGPRMFARDQIHQLLLAATPNMKAMILLAINGGLGNTDVAMLPTRAVNLDTGWLDYPRPKTGIARRVPLWPETVAAINESMAKRNKPKSADDRRLLFIGKRGESYVGEHKGYRVVQEFRRVCEKAKVSGRSFYDLRRTFQTVAEESCDLAAVQNIMGHAPGSNDMSSIYRQRVTDERLQRAVNIVRDWLYCQPAEKEPAPQDQADNTAEDEPPRIIRFRTVG